MDEEEGEVKSTLGQRLDVPVELPGEAGSDKSTSLLECQINF